MCTKTNVCFGSIIVIEVAFTAWEHFINEDSKYLIDCMHLFYAMYILVKDCIFGRIFLGPVPIKVSCTGTGIIGQVDAVTSHFVHS